MSRLSRTRAAFTQCAMGYAVGVYHPGNGYTDPAPYGLTPAELAGMVLAGYPVTLEHAGIDKAAGLLAALGVAETATAVRVALAATAPDTYGKEVGTVVATAMAGDGRWLCLLSLNDKLPAVAAMVRAGALRGLSLTHIVGAPPTPLEVSLCCQPARDGCYVECLVDKLHVAQEYMRRAITAPRRMTDTTMTDAKPRDINAIIDGLEEADRATIKAAVGGFIEEIRAARETAKMSTGAADAARSSNELLTNQIKTMSKLINPEIAQSFLCSEGEIMDDVNSGSMQRVVERFERVLACCNRWMMDQNVAIQSGSRKRPREPDAPEESRAPGAPDTSDPDLPPSAKLDSVSLGLAGAFGYTI